MHKVSFIYTKSCGLINVTKLLMAMHTSMGAKVDKKPNTVWIYICLSILSCAHVLSVCARVLSIWILCPCSLSLSYTHVLSVWVIHMFSQFELCTCSLSLSFVHAQNSNWENMRTQLKLREHAHNSKLRDNTRVGCLMHLTSIIVSEILLYT